MCCVEVGAHYVTVVHAVRRQPDRGEIKKRWSDGDGESDRETLRESDRETPRDRGRERERGV